MDVMAYTFVSLMTLCCVLLFSTGHGIPESSDDTVSIQVILSAMRDLQQQNREFEMRLREFEMRHKHHEIEIENLKRTNIILKNELSVLKKKEDPKTKTNFESFPNASVEKRLLMPVTEPGNNSMAVAFSVALAHTITLGQEQLVEYDKVVTNIGNAFDPRHSHFIAPIDGIYLLSACGFSQSPHYSHLDIVKNGIPIGYLFTHNDSIGTQVLVAVLKKGDMVWVKHTTNLYDGIGAAVLYGTKAEQFVTFSGALLHAL